MSQLLKQKLTQEEKDNGKEFSLCTRNHLGLGLPQLVILLEDFIVKRKNGILMKYVPMNVSPKTLLTTLNLDLKSIRMIFAYRVKAIKGEKKRIKKANRMIISELLAT